MRWSICGALVLGLALVTSLGLRVAAAQVPTFEQAYAHELKQLLATKAALEASRDTFERDLARHKAKLQRRIRQAETALLALKRRAREVAAKRDRLAEKDLVAEDHGAVLRALLSTTRPSDLGGGAGAVRASASASPDDIAKAFLSAVDVASREIDAGGRLHIEDGSFFGPDGKQVRGKIVHLGDIAALGLAPTTGGVLLKLDSGYRVLDEAAKDQARRIVAGQMPAVVDAFLFSPECTGHDPRAGNGLFGLLDKGGPVAWVIMGLALLGVLLVLERIWTLSRLTNWGPRRFDAFIASLRRGDFTGAAAITARMGAVGRVLRDVIEQRSLSREDLEKHASETVLKAMPVLERSLTTLVVITAVAPLLGLLGTVTGMISTFDVITEFGTGDPKLLSGGISEALVTTELGLSVAVPFLLVRSLLARWSDRIVENMQTYALAATNIIFGRQDDGDEL
jgi:biopolymer transport protein ExbB